MFVDREQELAFLNNLLTRKRPGPAQLVLLYGRRRVGKTRLLHHWANQCECPVIYWAAEKEPSALQRRKFYAAVLGVNLDEAPIYGNWAEAFAALARLVGNERRIVIIDELPYAAASDPAMLSALQHAWDEHFQSSNLVLILCGSQVNTMEMLMAHQSPLFGRMTGQWQLQPLPFGGLKHFLVDWSAEERVAGYALIGGIPAYLEWLDPEKTLVENIREVVLAPGSMFIAEPAFLLYDEVREPDVYLAIIKAIGLGAHTLSEINQVSLVGKSNLSSYLVRLQELHIVERRLPATVPLPMRRKSRMGRYHLTDAYFRFFFRFLASYHSTLTFGPDAVLKDIKDGLRAFVGQTAFEELCREWIVQKGHSGQLPFKPEVIGSHWSATVQVDVVAINWREKQILLGECKWGADGIHRQVAVELIEKKTPKTMSSLPDNGEGLTVHHTLFSRGKVTPATRDEMRKVGGLVVELNQLDRDLEEVARA